MKRAARIVALVAVLLLPLVAAAQHEVPQSVVGSGGGGSGGPNNRIVGTVGQAVIGVVSGPYHIHGIGFWYQALPGASEVPEGDTIPARFALGPGIPSPGGPVTTLRFAVPQRAAVAIRLYDVAGREVSRLAEGEVDPGFHTVVVDGSGLPGGVYFCRMVARGFVETRRLVLVK